MTGLAIARERGPAATVETVLASGLRGRGGAGFPTGVKWKTVAETAAPQKYIVCNADEGDSGTYADRMLLEGDPFSLIEGMAIAGLAVGASKGFVYTRSEYPHAIATFDKALAIARAAGILNAEFDIEQRTGAGAYVWPISIEGKVYNLPSHSELQMRDSERLYVNKINFKDYHKFTVESTIRTGSFAGSPQPASAAGSGNAAANPGGAEQVAESAQPQPPAPVSDERSAPQSDPPQSPSPTLASQTTAVPNPTSPAIDAESASPVPVAIQLPSPAPVPTLASLSAPAPLPGDALNSPYRLKIGVDLVTVPVVVRDRSGRSIGNLTRDDFEIFDKGKREPISAFNVESLWPAILN